MRYPGKPWLFGTFIATVVFALQIKATKGESLTSVSRSGQISSRSHDLVSVPLIFINAEPLLESLSASEPTENQTHSQHRHKSHREMIWIDKKVVHARAIAKSSAHSPPASGGAPTRSSHRAAGLPCASGHTACPARR